MKNIKLFTPYDCLIINDANQIFLQKDEFLDLDKDALLSIYPASSPNRVAFCLDTTCQQGSSFFEVVEQEDLKIFVLTKGNVCQNFFVHTFDLEKGKCTVKIGTNNVEFEFLQFKKLIELQNDFSKYKLGVQDNFVYVLLSATSVQTLILFDCEQGQIQILTGEEIKISGNNFTVKKIYQNIACHSILEQYSFLNGSLIKKSQEIGYQKGRPIFCTVPQTVPYAFLQAVQVGDGSLANEYLDISLRRRIDQEHLLAYFGKIKDFFPLDLQTYVVLGDEKSVFKFVMQDNKILEIEKK